VSLEFKSTAFEVKDINKGDRTAVIAFATYNNVDKTNDILRKGAFNKTWAENKSDIRFFFNHDPNQVPGKPLDFFEDDNHAYAKAYLGTHTLGEDTLKMMDEGIITDSSFGYKAVRHSMIEVKSSNKKARELKEVYQGEFSVLTHWGANPLSKVKNVTKGYYEDMEGLKERFLRLNKFIRNTTASDDAIKAAIKEADEIKSILFDDTADTSDGTPPASIDDEAQTEAIKSLSLKMFAKHVLS
jgi:HK97 family phage prohead protease